MENDKIIVHENRLGKAEPESEKRGQDVPEQPAQANGQEREKEKQVWAEERAHGERQRVGGRVRWKRMGWPQWGQRNLGRACAWSWPLNEAQRKELTRPQFVRYYLMKLGIGSELQRVALDPNHLHRLAGEAEIRELMPELKPPG